MLKYQNIRTIMQTQNDNLFKKNEILFILKMCKTKAKY